MFSWPLLKVFIPTGVAYCFQTSKYLVFLVSFVFFQSKFTLAFYTPSFLKPHYQPLSSITPCVSDQQSKGYITRADSRFAPSQWETALLCNDASDWLDANIQSALIFFTDWHANEATIQKQNNITPDFNNTKILAMLFVDKLYDQNKIL